MSSSVQMFIWPLFGYLIGSISSAVIVSRLMGFGDPRDSGSGNPGATNVLRSGGKLAGALTLVGDIAKGVVPVLLAQHYNAPIAAVALTAIAAFMGHLYPVFFAFKGGKGVATAIGIYFALSLQLGAVFMLTWVITAAIFRYSSLASLLASAVTALASFAIFNQQVQLQLVGAVMLIVAFTFKRHKDNLDRLKSGTERKIGGKK